jgi:hypothetical protein
MLLFISEFKKMAEEEDYSPKQVFNVDETAPSPTILPVRISPIFYITDKVFMRRGNAD